MLVRDPQNIRLAMLGMVDGNGHPYSWSAIINGRYNAEVMAACGYPVIAQYLGAQPPGALGLPGVRVTHVWCDDPAQARQVAQASFVPHVVDRPEDVIGQVDAVIIPTDKGEEHVERCRPFIEAGLPIFVDKPLVDREDHLRQFVAWQAAGHALMSTSCLRYPREFAALRARLGEVGRVRLITSTTPKSWARYGIHALEGAYPFLRPGGWEWASHSGGADAAIVHAHHADGVEVVIAAIDDMYGAMGHVSVYGTQGVISAGLSDRFNAFKSQLEAFVGYLRTGVPPFAFAETVELMKLVIAGLRSREEGGRRVMLTEIKAGA